MMNRQTGTGIARIAGMAVLFAALGLAPASHLFGDEAAPRTRPEPQAKMIVRVDVVNDQVTLGFDDGTALQIARRDLRIRDRRAAPRSDGSRSNAPAPDRIRMSPEDLEASLQPSAKTAIVSGIPVVVIVRLGRDGQATRARVDVMASLDDAGAFVTAWTERFAQHEQAGAGG